MKKSDAGMAIVLNDGLTAVAGIHIAEGEKLEVTLKKLVAEIAADDPKLAKMIEFDAEKHDGVNFHVAKIPLDEPLAAEVYAIRSKLSSARAHRACTWAPQGPPGHD